MATFSFCVSYSILETTMDDFMAREPMAVIVGLLKSKCDPVVYYNAVLMLLSSAEYQPFTGQYCIYVLYYDFFF